MKNITKSIEVLGRAIELLLGSDGTTSAEKILTDLKSRYLW